jgi:hypothetical protein
MVLNLINVKFVVSHLQLTDILEIMLEVIQVRDRSSVIFAVQHLLDLQR